MVIDPLQTPQLAGVLPTTISNGGGLITVTLCVSLQFFVSVTITVYTAGQRFVTVAVVAPPGDQEYV